MKFAYCCLAAILAALAFSGSAGAKTDAHAAAVRACTSADGLHPPRWLRPLTTDAAAAWCGFNDAEAALWLCNANEEVKVFALAQMTGDLLKGAGAYLVDSDEEGEADAESPP